MISLNENYVVDLGIELGIPKFPVRRAADCAHLIYINAEIRNILTIIPVTLLRLELFGSDQPARIRVI